MIIFSKVPIPGTVKTRLIKESRLDAAGAASLAEAMLKDTILLAIESDASDIVIGFTPAQEREFIKHIVQDVVSDEDLKKTISYVTQRGSSFDERFQSVTSTAFTSGSDNLVILGADLPYLPSDIINSAFSFLTEQGGDNSIVLGPAGEGGVYLVGITKRFDPECFSKYQLFSGGVEISQFVKLCENEGLALKLLPAFTDVDIEGDLISLLVYIEAMKIAQKVIGFHFPMYTAKAIAELGLVVSEEGGETRHRRIEIKRA